MNRITALLAAAVLAVGASAAVAQTAASPDQGTDPSNAAARQTRVDKGLSPSPTHMTTKKTSKKMAMHAKKKPVTHTTKSKSMMKNNTNPSSTAPSGDTSPGGGM